MKEQRRGKREAPKQAAAPEAEAGAPARAVVPDAYWQHYGLPGNAVQRAATGAAPAPGGLVREAARLGTGGEGGALPHLDAIQRSFGHHDVGGVRAHVGAEASAGAQLMGAKAFASGDRVAFDGAPDLHLAAHEAAHVVQQRGGVHLKGGVGEAGDPHEQHADAVAQRVVEGRSAQALLDQYAPAGGAPSTGGGVQGYFVYRDGRRMSEQTKSLIMARWQHNSGFGAFQTLANQSTAAPQAFEDYLDASALDESTRNAIAQLAAADVVPTGPALLPSPSDEPRDGDDVDVSFDGKTHYPGKVKRVDVKSPTNVVYWVTIGSQDVACLRRHLQKAKAPSSAPTESGSASKPKAMELSLTVDGKASKGNTKSSEPVPWAVGVVHQLSATQPLLQQAYDQGPSQLPTVSAAKDTPTAYAPETHHIDVQTSAKQEKAEALHQLVFELCNATLRDRYRQLELDAAAGNLDCIAYCVLKETLEYVSETKHDEFVAAILEDYKKLGRDDKKPLSAVPGLQELIYQLAGSRLAALKLQVNSGHTGGYFLQWIDQYAVKFATAQSGKKAALLAWLDGGSASGFLVSDLSAYQLKITMAELGEVARGIWTTYQSLLEPKDKSALQSALK